jgi:tetratricopeptide (TPR) repeat protein
MSHSLKQIFVSILVVVLIVWLYYWIPLWYEKYQLYLASQTANPLAVVPYSGSTETWSSIHDLSDSAELIASELPKLTKQTRALLDQYQQDHNPVYLFDLVSSLTDDGAYHTATSLYQILLRTYPDKATYTSYLTLLLNRGQYTPAFLTEYQSTVDALAASGMISSQDQLFFTSFRTLISGDVDTFYQVVHQLTWDYTPIASDLLNNLTAYSQYKQAPQQYLWGLFASTLLRHGYYAPAIHLAQQSLKLNPDYVLWFQVMAYAHMMIHDWSTAKQYLTKLMVQDSSHLLTYQRLYGIVSYRSGEHKDTVRYLTQVYDKIPNVELLRYIGLSYRSLYDYLHVAKTYRRILESNQTTEIDYFEFFDTYRRSVSYYSGMSITWTTNPIDQYDQALLSDYLESCTMTMTGNLSYLCDYGTALRQLFAGDTDRSLEIMIQVAKTYSYDFVYGMIGDIYLIKDQIPTAQLYYTKAIESSYNGWYQRYLSNKLRQLTVDGP